MADHPPEPDLTPSQSAMAAEHLWKTLQGINEWTRFADAKAAALLTANGVLGTIAAGLIGTPSASTDKNPYLIALVMIAGVALLASSLVCIKCLYPRTRVKRETSGSLLFFHHIARRHDTAQGYLDRARSLCEPDVAMREVGTQVWAIAKVAREKHKEVAIAIGLTASVLVVAVAGWVSPGSSPSAERERSARVSDTPNYPTGNVTIVFTDIENSTAMTGRLERLGRRGVYEAKLQEPQRDRLKAEAESRHGFEIQRSGDGHMFVFQRAADALACVVAFQRTLLADPITHREGDEAFAIRVRVGVHTTVLQRDPKPLDNGLVEYPGADTSFAFRVMSLGQGGQILISELAATEARSLGEYRLHPWSNRVLKSFEDRAHTVHEILYDPDQEPREPGMQWLPDWYQSEKKLYVERPGKEAEVLAQFLRRPGNPSDPLGKRAIGRDGHRIVTIKAEGGMGKTRLAVACAAKVADLFPDGVYFVPLAEVQPTEEAVAEAIGRSLGLEGKDALPSAVLEYLRPRTVLLVLDNYESVVPPVGDPEPRVARYLNRLIAQAHGLRLLVTGRSPVNVIDVEKVIPLDDGLEDDEALALFLDRARLRWGNDRDLTAAERPHWDRIRTLTDRIPLALELAAGWIRKGLAQVADGLAATPLGAQTGLPPGAIRFDNEIARRRHDSLTRSLDWSYDIIGNTAGPAAQYLFATCGLFASSFDSQTLAIIADTPTADDNLIRLQDASLVRFDEYTNRYHLHRFTREYAASRLGKPPAGDVTRRQFLDYYFRMVEAHASNSNDREGYERLDREWQNALAAFRIAESIQDKPTLLSVSGLGKYFQDRGLWSEAENFYLRCLLNLQANPNRSSEGAIQNNLGNVYHLQGRYDQALEAFASSLAIRRELKDRAGEGQTLNNMGGVYRLQGRYDQALEAYASSLAIKRESMDRVGESQTLIGIGNVHQIQGRYDQAIEAFASSLAIKREFMDRIGESQTLIGMGNVHRLQGRYDHALEAYASSLAICCEFKDRVGEGQTLIGMGNVHQIQGRYAQALEAYKSSLAIRREFKDRAGEGQTLNNMGGVYRLQGRYDQALEAYKSSLAIRREFKDRVGEGQTLNNMGGVYQFQGRYVQALEAYKSSLAIRREFKDRVGEGQTLVNLALLSESRGQLTEAIAWARHAVTVLEATEATMAYDKARETLTLLEGMATGGH